MSIFEYVISMVWFFDLGRYQFSPEVSMQILQVQAQLCSCSAQAPLLKRVSSLLDLKSWFWALLTGSHARVAR
jgi:hypothetical protein